MLSKTSFQLLITLFMQIFTARTHFIPQNASIAEVNTFLETFFARTNTTTVEEWEEALPTTEEREDMRKLLSHVYHLNVFDSLDKGLLTKYASLRKYLNITVIQGHFCVIHELIPREVQRFPRMWGYTVIASKTYALRPIHHSATHFDSDGPVCDQAAALFENTRSRTLVIAGASRYAVKGNHPSECQEHFQLADAAHNNRTMFHWVNVVLKALAAEETALKGNGHFFIQWHGMAETSCLASDVFLSTGVQNCSIYDEDIPVRRLLTNFNRLTAGQGMKASTPREDVDCRLTAGTNVFGRYLNGVPQEKVCKTIAEEKDVTGKFAHVEQKRASRENISLWTAVIEDAFPVPQASPQLSTIFLVIVLSITAFFA